MFELRAAQHSCAIGSTGAHQHPNLHQMIYVRRGALHLQIDGASYDVKAPAVIFISRLEQHALHVLSDTYERYTFDLDPCERTPQQNDAQRSGQQQRKQCVVMFFEEFEYSLRHEHPSAGVFCFLLPWV